MFSEQLSAQHHHLQKRICINAQLLSGGADYRRAGIHQYISQVLRHLPHDRNQTQIVFTQQKSALAAYPGLEVLPTRWPTERRLARILWEQTVWPWLASRHNLDLLHAMAFVTPILATCPTVVTVYDLSFIKFPDQFPTLQQLYLSSQTARSCRKARRVITISESSRQDVQRFFDVPNDHILVAPPGVDGAYRPLPENEVTQFRQRKGLPERFILHVGTLQPRKNIPLLINALAKIPQQDVGLFLVGGKGWQYDEIFARVEQLNLQDRVHFTGYVPDEELPFWYNAAALFAFPSVYEGFGMPVVEAMACGTAVVAANCSSIPEAGGEAALYFDPQSVESLVNRLTAVLDNPDICATMQAKGIQQAQKFSWTRASEITTLAYQQALDDN